MADSVAELRDPADLPASGAAPVAGTLPQAKMGHRRAAGLLRAARGLVRTHAFRLAGLYFLVFAVSVFGVTVTSRVDSPRYSCQILT